MHWPEALTPWDTTLFEFAIASLSQYNTRHYMIPPAYGVDFRILNGYVYLSARCLRPTRRSRRRVPLFVERAGYYFANWDRLYDDWLVKIRDLVREMSELDFSSLPDMEPLEVITSGAGQGSGNALLSSYHRLLDHALTLWQFHFEFLNLGYAAYLDFFGFCKAAFPSIPDLAIAKMVAGVDVDLFRPDDELKRLARLAVSSGIDDRFAGDVMEIWPRLESDEAGKAWIDEWTKAAEPWFNFSTGSGFYHSDKIWIENVEVPLGYIADYIGKVQEGKDLDRPVAALHVERDRVVSEYRELLDSDEDREAFDGKLGLSRTVFPYVENHNFYVEHWAHSVIWRKMRDLGGVLAGGGLHRRGRRRLHVQAERGLGRPVRPLQGLGRRAPRRAASRTGRPRSSVAVASTTRSSSGRHRRPSACRPRWSPSRSRSCSGASPPTRSRPGSTRAATTATGRSAASPPRRASWRARPASSSAPTRSPRSVDGEILVAPLTAPSWAPVFGKIKATVTDVGGMMSHAAIVCREYGLPAVTGTAFGTKTIKTGQMLRVDGNTGKVTILD